MPEYIDVSEATAIIEEKQKELCPTGKAVFGTDYDVYDLWQEINDRLNSIEPTDVAPVVHGEWKHLGGDEWCCTHCGHVIATEGSWEKPEKKYCDNCGAKIDLRNPKIKRESKK